MLDDILRWLAAGDTAIVTMGPLVALALAMLGGSGVTQLLKFPLARIIPAAWSDWAIRLLAILSTWLLLSWLAELPRALEVIVAVAQPYAYTGVMRVIRHRWPWLEATRAAGSVQPSDAAQEALLARRLERP